MGCLLFPLELLFDGIIEGWFFLMEWIVPEHYISHTVRIVLKIFVRYCCVAGVFLLICR